jgi:hypothetical protein
MAQAVWRTCPLTPSCITSAPPTPAARSSDPGWAYGRGGSSAGGGPPNGVPRGPMGYAPHPGGAPPPPPPGQARARVPSPGGLPAHLSLMLDKQGESLGITGPGGDVAGAMGDMTLSGSGGSGAAAAAAAAAAPAGARAAYTVPLANGGQGMVARAGVAYVPGAPGGGPGAPVTGPAGAPVRAGPLLVPDLVKQLAGRVDLLTSLLRCPICRVRAQGGG